MMNVNEDAALLKSNTLLKYSAFLCSDLKVWRCACKMSHCSNPFSSILFLRHANMYKSVSAKIRPLQFFHCVPLFKFWNCDVLYLIFVYIIIKDCTKYTDLFIGNLDWRYISVFQITSSHHCVLLYMMMSYLNHLPSSQPTSLIFLMSFSNLLVRLPHQNSVCIFCLIWSSYVS